MEGMKMMECTLPQYLKSGFTPLELKTVGWFTLKEFILAGCEFAALFQAGFGLFELKEAGCKIDTEEAWKLAFESDLYSLEQLKTAGCKGHFLRHFGVKMPELQKVQFIEFSLYN